MNHEYAQRGSVAIHKLYDFTALTDFLVRFCNDAHEAVYGVNQTRIRHATDYVCIWRTCVVRPSKKPSPPSDVIVCYPKFNTLIHPNIL